MTGDPVHGSSAVKGIESALLHPLSNKSITIVSSSSGAQLILVDLRCQPKTSWQQRLVREQAFFFKIVCKSSLSAFLTPDS